MSTPNGTNKKSLMDHATEGATKAFNGFTSMFKSAGPASPGPASPAAPVSPAGPVAPVAPAAPTGPSSGGKRRTYRAKRRAMKG